MKRLLTLSALTLSALISTAAYAQTASAVSAANPVCLQAGRVDNTKILDDSTIIFRMRAGPDYRNTLAHKCSGLKFNEGFAYVARGNSICKGTQIKVINTVGGSVCSLGEFSQEMKTAQ